MSDIAELDLDHLRSWIGREDVGTDVVSEDLARKYHATFDLAGRGSADGRGSAAPHPLLPRSAGGADVRSSGRTVTRSAAASFRRFRCPVACGPAAV